MMKNLKMYIVLFMIGIAAIVVSYSGKEDSENYSSLEQSKVDIKVQQGQPMALKSNIKLVSTPSYNELNEDELKEFSNQVKGISEINNLNQNQFIPTAEKINGSRDYYESSEAADLNSKSEMFIHI